MASILDAGLVGVFGAIFTFALVYSLVWGVLTWRNPFGKANSAVYSMIALSIALLSAAIAPIRSFIGFISPWFVAFALALFFILFLLSMFGLSPEKDFPKIIGDSKVYVWLIIISVLIIAAGLAFTFGQTALEGTTGSPQTNNGNMVVIGGNNNGNAYYPPGTEVINAGSTINAGTYSNVPLGMAGQPGSTATPDFKTNMINTMLHPKVLGLLLMMVIASLSIYFLSNNG